jgi:ribonuclease BN (tRNA processing enzyme)
MRITVLGACGAYPEAGESCSGYLFEADGFRLVVDLGYATMPRLLESVPAEQVDAVYVSHGHPDHCVDLNPLLRARALRDEPAPPLPVYSPPGALDAVLRLDRPAMLAGAYELHEFQVGSRWEIGPFAVDTRLLPHFLTNAAVRLTAAGRSVAYTGDGGPSPDLVDLARDADLLIAEASFADQVPEDNLGQLSSARDAGRQAAQAGVGGLLLTHLMHRVDPPLAAHFAAKEYAGGIGVAKAGLTSDL